jgi:hypothetical protein
VTSDVEVPAGQARGTTVSCPPVGRVISGGVTTSSSLVVLTASFREGTNRWRIEVRNTSSQSRTFRGFAYCL